MPTAEPPFNARVPPARWPAWLGVRRALKGLSPSTLGVILLLLAICALSIALNNVVGSLAGTGGPLKRPGTPLPFWRQVGVILMLLLATFMPIALSVVSAVNLAPPGGLPRVATLVLGALLGVAAGFALRLAVAQGLGLPFQGVSIKGQLLSIGPRFVLLAALLVLALEFVRHAERSAQAARQAELDRAALEREWAETRLHALRAQIEPHFLFNTLAHVRRLFETDPGSARSMFDSLMRYLQVALPHMRQDDATLEHEARLAEAYLQIQQIRMGRRLSFAIDLPPTLRPQSLPPMMLLTLVENAVKHGIQPARNGGAIHITAQPDGARWLLKVADSGAGFTPGHGTGTGTGLANIRARLAAQFGGRAALELEHNDLGGVTATLALPLPTPAGAAGGLA